MTKDELIENLENVPNNEEIMFIIYMKRRDVQQKWI